MPRSTVTSRPPWLQRLAGLGLLCLLPGCMQLPATVDQDPQLPQLQLRGHRFHVRSFGDPAAPVLVVLHGGPGADSRYLLGLAALADRYRVVFYDQLGSGLSERVPPAQISVDSFIADLDAIVDHHSPGRPVHLLGHSWGAMLASAYAGRHPQRVARLVLAEPGFLDADTLAAFDGGRPGWRAMLGFATAWLGKWRVASAGDPYARDDWFLQAVFPLTQPENTRCSRAQPPLQAWRFGSPAFQATVGRMMDDPAWGRTLDFARGLEHFHGPVLFLHGACNRAQDEAYQRRLMQRFSAQSHARLQTLADAGHFMFNDQPQASLAAVRGFLAEAD
ncbi:alpha/beta hydrolase [Pelomonas sp. CA6]|uniref:alpha/beta hydrolase n=1 Tax=Pelomonas sp. CA6 TaxID=2907999 RepID=UPI001F4C1131|nr:alpha/beta hydrolase [Pelomonas sp. CA6]MCH7344703.1 alpha/beta hydrolase [Pelomonas sp. CA6]